MTVKTNVQDIEQEIVDLEDRLRNARARLASASASHKGGGSYLPVPEGVFAPRTSSPYTSFFRPLSTRY